jgi:cobalt/nickel transport system permease protein
MHIPDGYLSPQTCAVGFVAAVPVWTIAVRRVQRVVKNRHVPTLAVLSAVSFLVMMFNIPIPDGTTAHAIGATIIAILLGPWAAVLAVSVALAFQALLFGDGGVLAYGFNCVNMAILAPFAGLAVYRLLSRRRSAATSASTSPASPPRSSSASSPPCSTTPPAPRCTPRTTCRRPSPRWHSPT